MKNIKLTFVIVFCFLSFTKGFSQSIFHENFENPDSVVSSGNPGWSLYSQVQTSGFFCDSTTAASLDSSMLSTISFSTIGLYHIILKFNHIISFELGGGIVEVSSDSGVTWQSATANEYLGSAMSFPYFNFFSGCEYYNWHCGYSWSSPNNTQWHSEVFDISGLCSNSQNVMVRFKMMHGLTQLLGSWFLDDVNIDGKPYSTSSTLACDSFETATVTPYFGTPPYTYQWSTVPVQTTQTATGLVSGTYYFTVTDAFSVSFSDSVIVRPAIKINSYVYNPNCGGASNGSIAVTAIGTGVVQITDGSTFGAGNFSLQNLPVGTYTLTFTDNNCTVTKTYTLTCGFSGANVVIASTGSDCDSATGTATVQNFIGGTPPFTYNWQTVPVQTTQTATGLSGHTYYVVTVYDSNSDSATSGVYIPFNDTIIASAIHTPTLCNDSSGTATANGTGGVSPYVYQWSTIPTQTTQTIINLANINYTVTVTDANGCTDDYTFLLPNSSSMAANTASNPEQCVQANGTATVFVGGGTAPYSYQWSTVPVQTNATATGLSAGNYTVIITDASGCSLTKNVFVGNTSPITVSISYFNPFCTCVNATATPSGGVAPYSYLWGDGQTTQTDTCLNVGWHYVKVTDANGCYKTHSFYVNFPANCWIDISGYVFADLNSDCNYGAGEYGIANVQMNLTSVANNYYTYTNNSGYYSFHVLNDSFQLSQFVPPLWNQLCPDNPDYYIVNVPSGSFVSLDFADSADSYFDDVEITNCSSSPNVRGFQDNYFISIKNKGTNQLSGNLISKLDPLMVYQSASPAASFNLPTNTVTWNYTGFNPGANYYFNATAIIPAATPLGTLLFDSAYATPLITDVAPADNYCNNSAIVVGSYDPNNKAVNPENIIHKDSLWHFYIINFQNTGNSPAVRVVVEDVLDNDLDFSSITDFNASHIFSIDTSAFPLVRFIFDNINLVDSGTYEPGSHGFISFRIKHKTGLAAGTQITNTGYIYFDFNSAIVTNTVTNTLVNSLGVADFNSNNLLSVYPNPACEKVFVNYLIHNNANAKIELFDLFGRKIKSISANMNSSGKYQTEINLKELKISKGVYVIKLTENNISESVRLIVL